MSSFQVLQLQVSKVRPNVIAILYFVRVCECAIRRLAFEWHINTFGSLVQVIGNDVISPFSQIEICTIKICVACGTTVIKRQCYK